MMLLAISFFGVANVNTACTFLFDSARKRMERGHLARPYADSTIYATALGGSTSCETPNA